jgi:hypothetical protein
LTLFIFTQTLILIPLVKAEGSYELVKDDTTGYRPYLLFATDKLAGTQIDYKTTIKVFVNQGEQVNVGSSVPISDSSFNKKDIVYFDPTGQEIDHCDVADDPNAPKPIGLIKTLDEEKFGPEASTDLTDDPQRYTPCVFTALTTGVYKIEFHAPLYKPTINNTPTTSIKTTDPFLPDPIDPTKQKVGIAAWDVTVFKTPNDPTTKQTGRVYANYLPLYTPGTTSSINSQLFILSKVGHSYHIHLNGIQPLKFVFFANNKGFMGTNGNPLLKSVPAAATDTVNIHNPSQADDADNTTYKIFFNEPATDLPLEANSKGDWNNSTNDKTWLLSTPPLPPTVTNFIFTGKEGTANQAGTTNPQGGQFSFDTDRAGNYILTIDVDQDGIYGNNNDRVITGTANTGTTNTVNWDGLDGGNNSLAVKVIPYKAKLLLSTDEVHFPFFDVENNPNGLIIDRLTACPTGGCDVVYYDDSGFTDGKKKIDGESSSSGAHKFNNDFGNDKGIDTWTSITAEPSSPLDINIKEVDLEVTKTHSPDNISSGSTVTYTITVRNKDGHSDVTGIGVKDVIPSDISGVTWTCAVDSTGSGNGCAQSNGVGNIDTTVDLKNGAVATFTVQGTIMAGSEIKNKAIIVRPNDVTNLGSSTESEDTITLIAPPSQPPIANDDSISTQANTAVTIPILSNDTDDNSLNISSVTITSLPNNGTNQVLADGTVKYTPNTGFSGTDTFIYKVCDADSLCDLATVTITIAPPPPPPPPPVTPPVTPPPPVINKLLSIKITGKGTVTSNPGSIKCHNGIGVCALGFEIGTQVTLGAKPDSGWKFKEWKQDCDNNGKVTLNSDKNCEAVFVQIQQLTLTVFITGQGSVTATIPPGGINCGADCSNEYAEETPVVLKATPATGWRLEGWRGHCNQQGEVTLLETDKQCRTIFTPITTPLEPFKVTVYKTGQGTVVSEPSGINCGGTCSAQYDGSHGVQLLATPDSGWKLEGWRGHCDENGQVVRSSASYDHAQCRVIFLLEPSSVTPPTPSTIDNTQPTNNDNNVQVNGNDNNQPNDNPSSQDNDHDGVSNSIENVAPNSGDGNNDGIPDNQQNNVISSPNGGQYVTVEETNGCPVQANPPAATAIDLNLSCSQANLKTYYHGISDYQNLPSFQPGSTGGNSNTIQTPPVTYNTVMIQGQPVAVESVSLSDGGIGDNIKNDGKITYTIRQSSLPSNETQTTTTDSSNQVSPLPNNDTTNSVLTIVGQEIDDGFNPNNTNQNTTTGVNNTASTTINRCLSFPSTTTQFSSWSQIVQVGDTTTITLNTGPGELLIKEMPDPTLVSVEHWQSLNGNVELSLTGLSVGDTQMTLSDSAASQQATLYITVIATAHSANSAPPLVEKEVKTLQTVVQVGQDIDLVVTGGQGSLTLTQLPNSSLVSLTHWQNQTNGTAYFTLTGLNIGNTNLVITDEATPPQQTNVNISILANRSSLVIEPTITDDPENSTTACQGDTLGIDLQNRPNQACFMGKVISLGDLRSSAHLLTPTEAQNARVTATVLISPADVGKSAKILLVGKHTNLNGETTLYIRDDSRDKYSWQKWDGQIEQIPPSQYYPQLPEIIDIFIYEGDLSAMPGEFMVFLGYQLSDDIIIYNGLKPIQFWVDN